MIKVEIASIHLIHRIVAKTLMMIVQMIVVYTLKIFGINKGFSLLTCLMQMPVKSFLKKVV
jgi:hypothetical protein